MTAITNSPFHHGEQQIQQRLGVRDKMERFGRQVIRDYMPEQHQTFYAQLPFIFVAHADAQGWPWASILFNQPGFIAATDNKHLQIKAAPVVGDPLNDALTIGDRWGLLGIELSTRRRNRLAARISQTSAKCIELEIDQAFGNCPQYIQQRELHRLDPKVLPPAQVVDLKEFDAQALELISNSDTFFVASYIANGSDAASEGADVSHRGGKPGFIRVDSPQLLTIPDYLGNFHFNTLGNFSENAKAGLLFIDFTHGHLLTLTGTVEILWDSPDTKFFAGAERLWTFRLDHGRWLKNGLPLRWDLKAYAPTTTLTGRWQEATAAKNSDSLKNTWQAEAFGPTSLVRDEDQVNTLPVAEAAIINFTESKVEQAWSKGDGTLLEFAEAHGLSPEYGCRSGQCGTCKVKLKRGKVSYQQAFTADLNADEILLCCAMPANSETAELMQLDIQL